MEKVNHQLLEHEYFVPSWPIKYLFLGTFNPEGGDKVNYYYGRSKNQTWSCLSKIFGRELDVNSSDFFNQIQDLGIGCMDLIKSVEIQSYDIKNVIGNGYKDSNIINNKCIRNYNTNEIKAIIQKNPGVKVFSTWGTGSNLNDWKFEVMKIENIIPLVSPSLAARVPKGVNKIEFICNDWRSKIVKF